MASTGRSQYGCDARRKRRQAAIYAGALSPVIVDIDTDITEIGKSCAATRIARGSGTSARPASFNRRVESSATTLIRLLPIGIGLILRQLTTAIRSIAVNGIARASHRTTGTDARTSRELNASLFNGNR